MIKESGKGQIHKIVNGKTISKMMFQIDPTEFSDTVSIDWAEIVSPGLRSPHHSFITTKPRQFSVEIFLDAMEAQRYKVSLKDWMDFLDSFLPSYDKTLKAPCDALFAYGPMIALCRVISLERDFTFFDKDLNPIRATAKITLETKFQ